MGQETRGISTGLLKKAKSYIYILPRISGLLVVTAASIIPVFPFILDFITRNLKFVSEIPSVYLYILTIIVTASISLNLYSVFGKLTSSLGYQAASSSFELEVFNQPRLRQAIEEAYASEPASERSRRFNSAHLKKSYKGGEPLKAVELGKDRLLEHIARLRNNSILNLFVSVGFAIFGLVILASAYLEIEKFRDTASLSLNISEFVVIVLVPRISIALFIQVFSYFFLLMYRANLNDIKYFQNEITNLDLSAAAISMSMRQNLHQSQRAVVASLLKTERNRILSKGQKLVSVSDDGESVGKLIDSNRNLAEILRAKSSN